MQPAGELEELRVGLERVRTLLENLVVRGLRACGPDELSQINSYAEHFDQSGAGHLASLLFELKSQIERDDRTSARQLLEVQTNVRLLERLLTLRVVKGYYQAAIEMAENPELQSDIECDLDEQDDSDDEESDEE